MEARQTTRRLATTAIMLALAAILSLIKVLPMPLGGSVTLLSMLPVAIISIKYGAKWGFFGAFLYSLIQFLLDLGQIMSWGLTPTILAGSIIFDYLLAYTSLGLCGVFGKKSIGAICKGISLAMISRFLFHFISGSIFFATWAAKGWNVYLYSICYNGAYMLPEMIFTIIGAAILFKISSVKKLLY